MNAADNEANGLGGAGHSQQQSPPPRPDCRQIVIDGPQTARYVTNAISTTKYTCLSFLPLFLYEQFHNYNNCFFLLISIIQQFPEASSLGRFTTLIPLCVILAVSAVKEIVEDVSRYRADRNVNRHRVDVRLTDGGGGGGGDPCRLWTSVEWRCVRVGEIVRVRNNESFPADLLLLESSATASGVCYIETVHLDGEDNLKVRRRVPAARPLGSVSRSQQQPDIVECDLPNEKIYKFDGVLQQRNCPAVPLNADQILLRGSILRNTEWIVGLVVYTGAETKIMKNSSNTRLKRSSVSDMVNSHIVSLFALFLGFTFLHWGLFLAWNNTHHARLWYVPTDEQSLTDSSTWVLCLVYGVIYSILIPISLQVMQEVSRLVQGVFINNDIDMYDEAKDMPAIVKTSNLNEDLALVKYIFSDKTGTLTKNMLEFECCSVRGAVYDAEQIRRLGAAADTPADHPLYAFFVAIGACPGVIPVSDGDDDAISYNASSPDQKALLLAACDFGCTLLNRSHDRVDLRLRRDRHHYSVLCDFEFSSDRRRTSVIVRDEGGQISLFAMGADDVILPRCNGGGAGDCREGQNDTEAMTQRHSETFASQGLRLLFVATRRIEQGVFDAWYPTYRKACDAAANKERLMEEAESSILNDLTLLGCSAIRDQLQECVPETIESLTQAGISTWILTGDRRETAVNVGYACRLLADELPLVVLDSSDVQRTSGEVARYKRTLDGRFGCPGNAYALLVSGECLAAMMESTPDAVADFVRLMLSCRSVICYRTTPRQKASVVGSVRAHTKAVTLAIGDGANDVAMIRVASIGVGISGAEGMQAANAADYAIGQFRYLRKLLLVHGTWSYTRICKMIYFIYYKNVAFVTLQFYYTATNGWSGQVFVDRWAKAMYNVLLTCAPTLVMGVFEQGGRSPDALLDNPYLYTRNRWFDVRSFYLCLANAVGHASLLSWLTLAALDSDVFWACGRNENYMVLGNVVYTCLILVVALKCGLHTGHWTHATVFAIVGSQAAWLLLFAALSHAWPWLPLGEDISGLFEMVLRAPLMWLFVAFAVVAVLLVDLIAVALYRTFATTLLPYSRVGASSTYSIHFFT